MSHRSAQASPARRRLAVCLAAVAVVSSGLPARAELEAEEIEIKAVIASWRNEMIETLQRWVDVNTGSANLAGLEQFATLLPQQFAALGFTAETREGSMIEVPSLGSFRSGPLIIARRPATPTEEEEESAPRFLLIGHYDTVFEPGSPFQEFRRNRLGGRARGPGVADMKGGIVVMLFALRALYESGDLDLADWTVVLNADEELGSLGSRERIEREASAASYGFVFESAHAGGAMVRSRRGLGQFHLAVQGVAAHAGNAHAQGSSAIRELADKILKIEALTDYERGVTLNVGTVRGGTKRNIVPDSAEAWIDLRYDDPETGQEVFGEIEQIAAESFVEGTTSELWGTLHRPPKPESEETLRLLERHAAVARDLGIELGEPIHSGGGTDGSLTSAAGLPTLDSMGVVGAGAHTEQEYLDLDSLTERAAISAILLRRLARDSGRAVE